MTSRKLCSSFWRFYPLIALCSVAIGTDAQMVSVTWNLNMTNETVATEGPSVAGGTGLWLSWRQPDERS